MVGSLQAAKAWGKSPLLFLGRGDVWNEDAVILATALVAYEKTRVDGLGFPKRTTEEGDNEGHFEVREGFNAAQQALDIYRAEQGDKPSDPGTITWVEDTRTKS